MKEQSRKSEKESAKSNAVNKPPSRKLTDEERRVARDDLKIQLTILYKLQKRKNKIS